jgi:hypothetical protein
MHIDCIFLLAMAIIGVLHFDFHPGFHINLHRFFSDGGLGHSSLPVYSGWGVKANSIQIRFQSTDTTVLTVVTGTVSSDVTAITLKTGFPLSTSLVSSGSSGGPGLSVGAKIGIGVAVPIVVIAILVGVFITWWRNRHRRSTRQLLTSNPEPSMRGYPKTPELESVVVPIVSPLSPQGTQFQGTAAEFERNSKAYIQVIGTGKNDDDHDLGGMKIELDEIQEERNRILRLQELAKRENTIRKKMAQGGKNTEVGEMEG